MDEVRPAPKPGAIPTSLYPDIHGRRFRAARLLYPTFRPDARWKRNFFPSRPPTCGKNRASGLLRLPAADLDARDGQGEDEPENAHHPGIVPEVVGQPRHHAAAEGAAGRRGDAPGGGVGAVPNLAGGVLDVPEHGGEEAHETQRAGLHPQLQIDVVGVDVGRVGVVEVVVRDELLHRGGSKARAGDGRGPHHADGRLVEGHPARGGGVRGVGDGQDPVPDGGRQQRDTADARRHEEREVPGLPEEHEDHRRAGDAHPAGPGIGHAQGREAHGEGPRRGQTGPPAFGADGQRHQQRQQQDQHLGEGVGVIEDGHDPPGHALVDGGVHVGLVDLHALDPLIDTVEGRHQHHEAAGGGQALEVRRDPDGADRTQQAERRADVVEEEAPGDAGIVGERHRKTDGGEEQHRVEAHGPDVQPLLFPHAPQEDAQQEQHPRQELIGVVPPGKGDDPEGHPQPGLGDGPLPADLKGEIREKTAVKGRLPAKVDPVAEPHREVHHRADGPAEEALLPGPGHLPLPAEDPEDGGLVHLGVEPADQGGEAPAQAALPPEAADAREKGV